MAEYPSTTFAAANSSTLDFDLDLYEDNSKALYYRTARKAMMQIVPPFIFAFGTFGNIMIVLVFNRNQSTSTLSTFFKALAVSDLCLIYVGLFPWWTDFIFDFNLHDSHKILCKLLTHVYYVAGVVSVWLVVAMTVQRATSVLWPHKVNLLCTKVKVRVYIALILLFSVLINSHHFYGQTLILDANNTNVRCGTNLVVEEYAFFIYKIWAWIDGMMFSLLPSLILIVSNSILVWKVASSVRKARVTLASNQSDHLSARTKQVSSLTNTLIVVSLAFFVLSAPLSFYIIIAPYTIWIYKLDPAETAAEILLFDALMLLWYSNSAANFYLYCLTGTKFRNDFWQLLTCLRGKESTLPFSDTQMSEMYTKEKTHDTEF